MLTGVAEALENRNCNAELIRAAAAAAESESCIRRISLEEDRTRRAPRASVPRALPQRLDISRTNVPIEVAIWRFGSTI